MKYHLTLKSTNKKTGPIPVSTQSRLTCPTSCPFRQNGCYADGGPLRHHWEKVTSGERGDEYPEFLDKIKALPEGQLWRWGQAGDLPGSGDDVDLDKLSQLVEANQGRRGFGYTHTPVLSRPEYRSPIREANQKGFTLNLSGNHLSHADALYDLGIGPVVVTLDKSIQGRQKLETPKGRRVVVCPASYMHNVSCATCQLCSDANREVIVGFPAHGAGARKVSSIAQGDQTYGPTGSATAEPAAGSAQAA